MRTTRSRHVAEEVTREVKTSEREKLYHLYQTAFDKQHSRDAAYQRGPFKNSDSVGVFVDGKLVAAGTALYHEGGKVAEIALLCVLPSIVGGGYGKKAANALLTFVGGKLARKLKTYVLNADAQSGAVRFWQSMGFKEGHHGYVDHSYGNTKPMVRKAK